MLTHTKNATIIIEFALCILYSTRKLRRRPMSTVTTDLKNSTSITSKFTEEFEKYLKKQSLKTTFNGCDIETFSWYKKALGIGC